MARSTAAASMLHFENCAPRTAAVLFFSPPFSLSLSRKVTREKFYELCSTRFFFFISFQFRVTRPRERKYGGALIYINILIRETETPGLIC